jgi:hypothetical protein
MMVTGTKRMRLPFCLFLIPDHFDRLLMPLRVWIVYFNAAFSSSENLRREPLERGQLVLPGIRV